MNGGGMQLLQPLYTSEVHGTAVNQTGCEAEIDHATNESVKHTAGSNTRLDEELT